MPKVGLDGKWSHSEIRTKTVTTTNDYADAWNNPIEHIKNLTVQLLETGGVNGALYSIDVAMDATNFKNLMTDQALAASGLEYETLTDNWQRLRVQVKAAIGGSQADVRVRVMGDYK